MDRSATAPAPVPTPTTTSSAAMTWAAGILAALVLVAASVVAGGDPVDDAGITYRFAKRLAAGDGLAFNPGARVEGYVHFLWIALLAATERVTGVEPMSAGPWFGRVFGALAVLWVALLARRIASGPYASVGTGTTGGSGGAAIGRWHLAAPFLLGTNLYFVLWAQAGLETPLFCWLSLVVLHLAACGGRRATVGAPLVGVLLCMTRPEGILILGALALDAQLGRRIDRRTFQVLAWFAIPGAIYFAWRWSYFGYLLPNVFYAKSGLPWQAGFIYVGRFLGRIEPRIVLPTAAVVVLIAATALPTLAVLRALFRRPLRRYVLVVAAWFAGVLWEGGDWMGCFRFLVPSLPALALLGACVAGVASARTRPWAGGMLVGVVLAFNVANGAWYATLDEHDPRRTWFHQADYYDDAAQWVREHVEPGSLVALGDMGYIPYATMDVNYLDFLGLVDPFVAHLPDGILNPEIFRYIHERKPRYFLSIVHHAPDGTRRGHTPVDTAMLRFDDASLAASSRLYRKIAERPGWIEDGARVSFYIYAPSGGQ